MARSMKAHLPGQLRVVVADDLGFMRIALRQIIEADGDMRVVGEARNGEEAVALVRELRPDIVTMDVEMPVMDGIEATRRIASEVSPPPAIIMVSSHTQAGAAATIKALRVGAADFVSKESAFARTDLGQIDAELRDKIRQSADRRRDRRVNAAIQPEAASLVREIGDAAILGRPACHPSGPVDLVAIAVSTGGPSALAILLRGLGAIAAPIVVAQHMPRFFTACLAESLNQDTGLLVREGEHRTPVLPGQVTILPGGRDGVVAPREGGGFELRLTLSDSPVHPSADLLFESAAMVARNPVAVILTGMGSDGARGAGLIKKAGGYVISEAESSCVVYGMPRAVFEAGHSDEVLPLDAIADGITRQVRDVAARSA